MKYWTWIAIAAGAGLALLLTSRQGSATVGGLLGFSGPHAAPAGPVPGVPNGRRMREGYLLGRLPEGQAHVDALRQAGIRAVLSIQEPSPEVVAAMQRAGMDWYHIPMGASFRHADVIDRIVRSYDPSQIYIHCRHGVDRTGNTAAYILVRHHRWNIADALYSAVNPNPTDLEGLHFILNEQGVRSARRQVGEQGVSINAGPEGGMKVRSGGWQGTGYFDLVRTSIQAMRR